MGCRFGLNGKMVLRESQEVVDKLEDLKELIGEIEMTCQAKDGLVEVSLSGEYSMSYGTVVEIEKTLKEFSAHAVESTYFDTDCDGEEGIIWVGKPEDIKKAQRGKLIYETVVLLQQLTLDEIQMALKMASDTKPAAPPDDPRTNTDHPEHDLYLLSDLIFKGFSCYHDSVVLDRVDRFEVKTEKGDYTLTIEEEDDYNPLNMGTHLKSSGSMPNKLKDHVTVMDVALIGLGADPSIAKEITDLVTDGDHKDCEADFNFRGKAWTIKVR